MSRLHKDTELHIAVKQGKLSAIETLVCRVLPHDLTAKDSHGFTALDIACKQGSIHTVVQLLTAIQRFSNSFSDDEYESVMYTALICAAENGQPTILDLLVSQGVDVNLDRDSYVGERK